MNRGSPRISEGLRLAIEASMRPRFMNRGSFRRRTNRCESPRRFNEAPIHESGKFGHRAVRRERPDQLQ